MLLYKISYYKKIIFSIQFFVVLFFVVASVCARGHGGGQSSGSGESGEHGGKNCTIVPTGTTNCTGVTGPNCTDQANLQVNTNAMKILLKLSSIEIN
jgi:hypothetical protein